MQTGEKLLQKRGLALSPLPKMIERGYIFSPFIPNWRKVVVTEKTNYVSMYFKSYFSSLLLTFYFYKEMSTQEINKTETPKENKTTASLRNKTCK